MVTGVLGLSLTETLFETSSFSVNVSDVVGFTTARLLLSPGFVRFGEENVGVRRYFVFSLPYWMCQSGHSQKPDTEHGGSTYLAAVVLLMFLPTSGYELRCTVHRHVDSLEDDLVTTPSD